MTSGSIAQRLGRIRDVWREEGPPAVARRLIALFLSPGRRIYLRRKRAEDRGFDGTHGVDTGGLQRIDGLATVDGDAAAAIGHIAIPPGHFAAAIDALDLDPRDLAFIDLGSGKGRALILASALPFRRLIGIEFATRLHQIAAANFAALGQAVGPGERIDLVNGDAASFALPPEPSLMFLFHPFGPPVIDAVAGAALASWRQSPRPIRVLYVNPVHLDAWTGCGWQLLRHDPAFAMLGPPTEPAGT